MISSSCHIEADILQEPDLTIATNLFEFADKISINLWQFKTLLFSLLISFIYIYTSKLHKTYTYTTRNDATIQMSNKNQPTKKNKKIIIKTNNQI